MAAKPVFSQLRMPLSSDSSTTAPPGSNRAGNSSCWCRSPTWLSKPDTGPYRGEFGFSVFVCLRCARKHILASAFRISFAEALFFVYSTAILRRPPPLFPGKRKAGISSSLCKNIHSSTTFWSKRIRILAAWARVVVPPGSKVPSSWPLMSSLPLAQAIVHTATLFQSRKRANCSWWYRK